MTTFLALIQTMYLRKGGKRPENVKRNTAFCFNPLRTDGSRVAPNGETQFSTEF